MIEHSHEKYRKQGNHYYSKVKKKLVNYQDDLQFMHKQISRKFRFVPCGGCANGCSRSSRDFQRAFKTLSQIQKSQYYYSFTRLTYNTLFNIPQQAIVFPQKKQITQVYFLSCLTWKWQLKDIQIDYLQRKITLINQQISINLRNFIMRLSKNKERKGVVLESLCCIEYIETIRISNYNEAFQDLEKKFTVLMASALRERISRKLGIDLIINEEKSMDGKKSVSIENQLQQRVLSFPQKLKVTRSFKQEGEGEVIPTEKLIPIVFQRKGSTFDIIKPKIESFSHFQQFQQIRENVFYNEQETIMRKQYEFQYQNQSYIILPWICDNLMNHKYFKHWKKSLLKSKLLQQNSNSKLFHQIYHTRQKLKLDLYYIRTKYAQKQIIYLFDSPNLQETLQSNAQLDYCLTKIQKINNYLKILMQCRIKFKKQISKQSKKQVHDDFLGNIANIINGIIHKNQEINSIAFEDDYLSKINFTEKNPEDSFFSIYNNTTQSDFTFEECTEKPMHVWDQHQQIHSNNFLKVTHCLQPFPKLAQRLKYPKSPGKHPCWEDQWKINEKGEMISINLQKVKAQNSVLKEVLKNLGKNFLSGRTILNVSLPVTIFSTQTNLSNICNSYSYAPRLLQQAARQKSPVDKMKYVVAFNISCAIIEIQMQKPFNPILGETYQATIDGCPVFGEQICHHPPISATYMKGRGYKLFGQIQSKVSMGINSAVGTSDGIMNIIFEDGSSEIKYTSFSGEMTGLVLGDRKLSFVGSNHFVDTKNNIYLQMRFGKHKGITQYSKYVDGVQGKIVKIKQGLDLSKFWEMKKEHIVEQYGYIHGRWTNDIYYEYECIFNSWNHLPYIVTPYLHSLDSDSLKRLDLKERVNLNCEKAQQYKEDLEMLQRNDRKLRQAHKR